MPVKAGCGAAPQYCCIASKSGGEVVFGVDDEHGGVHHVVEGAAGGGQDGNLLVASLLDSERRLPQIDRMIGFTGRFQRHVLQRLHALHRKVVRNDA
jgi:hypothetical protein